MQKKDLLWTEKLLMDQVFSLRLSLSPISRVVKLSRRSPKKGNFKKGAII
jgi:hypothetical protein